MARVNVYLPDDLAERARAAGVNVSAVTQAALETELAGRATSAWLSQVAEIPPVDVPHDQVVAAVRSAREELGARSD